MQTNRRSSYRYFLWSWPRINAVSRIYGDAKFCVELLTSKDKKRCQELAIETELANTRRKGLQKKLVTM